MAPTDPAGTDASKDAAKEQVLRSLLWNSRLNFTVRMLLMLFCLVVGVVAVLYVSERADAMVEFLRQPRVTGEMIGERLLALTAPLLLLMLLMGLAVAAALVTHSRGAEETHRTLDSINRLRRENEVAVSARGLIVGFEEQLGSTRRAFTLLLWFGHTLFVVCLGLFVGAVLSAVISGVDLLTVALGTTSVVGALLGVVTGVPGKVSHNLADVIQMQAIVTGTQRQISLLESHALAALNHKRTPPELKHSILMEVHGSMERVVKQAVEQIERFADQQPDDADIAKVTQLRPAA